MPDSRAFDLVDGEPWLQVETDKGEKTPLSLIDVFDRSAELRGLVGDVPTQVFSQVRLLLAILYGALRRKPFTMATWEEMWASRAGLAQYVETYLYSAEIRSRFDLLHPVNPFYQVAELRTERDQIFGLEKLIADIPTGFQYFTTRAGKGLERIGYPEAARWVVHCHAFDVAGIKTGAVGDPRVKPGSGKSYGSSVGHCGNLGGVMAEGANLTETLLLNLIPYTEFTADQVRQEFDRPVWERDPHTAAQEAFDATAGRRPNGPCDLYTWQSRRIRLAHDGEGVTGVLVANGDSLEAGNLHDIEPMTAWRYSANKSKEKKFAVYLPRLHRPERSLWRGLASLLPKTVLSDQVRESRSPKVLEWIGKVAESQRSGIDATAMIRTRAIGIAYGTQNSVVAEMMDDGVVMSVLLFSEAERALRTIAQDAVDVAERTARAVATLARELALAAGGDSATAEAAFVQAKEDAYSLMDRSFRTWIGGLTSESDEYLVRGDWERRLLALLSRLARRLTEEAGPDAWMGRVIDGKIVDSAEAELDFWRSLRAALPLAHEREETPDE